MEDDWLLVDWKVSVIVDLWLSEVPLASIVIQSHESMPPLIPSVAVLPIMLSTFSSCSVIVVSWGLPPPVFRISFFRIIPLPLVVLDQSCHFRRTSSVVRDTWDIEFTAVDISCHARFFFSLVTTSENLLYHLFYFNAVYEDIQLIGSEARLSLLGFCRHVADMTIYTLLQATQETEHTLTHDLYLKPAC